MNLEKLQEVLSDEAFVKSLFALETAAEVQAALQEKGVELSEEEILAIRDLLQKVKSGEITKEQLETWAKQAADGELSDEVLEQIAGGLGPISGAFALAAAVVGVFGGFSLLGYFLD